MKKEDYMLLSKERLAELLEERDNEEKQYFPLNLRTGKMCSSWKDCTNPQKDCIDCPLHTPDAGRQWVTNCTAEIQSNL